MNGNMNLKDTNMENKDLNSYIDDLLCNLELPTDSELKEETKAEKVSLALKGKKHTEQTKTKWSNAKKGKKIPIDIVEKSRRGIIQTKWEQTLSRLSKQDILDAQSKHGNHQKNTMKELGISFRPYKKLCEYYKIELKKSNYEKTEWARETQSEEVNVYRYDKTKENGLGEYIGTYYSISEASRQLNIHRTHAVRVSNGKRNHTGGYVIKKC